MHRIRSRGRLTACSTVTCLLIAAGIHAGDAVVRDCEPGAVRAGIEGQRLTRAERIARMDQAFYDSLARFDECRSPAAAAGSQDGMAGSNPGTAGASAGTADARGGASIESVPAHGIQGGEAPEPGETAAATTQAPGGGAPIESVPAQGVQGTEPPGSGEATTAATTTTATQAPPPGSGKIPDDIPSPDNDSVLAAQIRRAAMEEPDPRLRAELWNEYRRYKGLPVKPLPEEGGGNTDAQESE